MYDVDDRKNTYTTPAGNPGGITERGRHIPEQLCMLEVRINRTSELIDQLTSRLYPVLSNPCPQTEGASAKSEDLTPMADHIRELSRRISFHNSHLEDLLERLEM